MYTTDVTLKTWGFSVGIFYVDVDFTPIDLINTQIQACESNIKVVVKKCN